MSYEYHQPGQHSNCSPERCGHPRVGPMTTSRAAQEKLTSPRTEAGRAFIERGYLLGDVARWPAAIRAIEAEAAAATPSLTIEQVERALFAVAPSGDQGDDWAFAVLARLAARLDEGSATPDPSAATCEWCGAPLVNEGGVWTDRTYNSGDYCPEGRAVGPEGTSPHKPDAATPDQPGDTRA